MHPEFNLNPDTLYLNHAAVAPWPRRTQNAVRRFALDGARYYPRWMQVEQGLRERAARLLNAPSAEAIALLKNTSEALSVVAQGLAWQAGDNVVGIAQEFPSNRMAWEALASQGVGFRALDLYHSEDPESDLIELCDRRTRLLSVSSVQYARGLRLNLQRLGENCRKKGILLCVDAIQHLGALPFDAQAAQADFVAADGHKWMLGPEGLALFYVRDEAREQLRLRQHGWHMAQHLGDYERPDWRPAASARRFECGSPNMLGIHALEASLSLLEEIGSAAIFAAIAEKIEQIYELADKNHYEVLSPRDPSRRSGIATIRLPDSDHTALYQALMQQGVICALRGGGIRFSPHYHTSAEVIDEAFAILQKTSRQ